MKTIFLFVSFLTCSILSSQVYNPTYIAKYEVLQLDRPENILRYSPFRISEGYDGSSPYPKENYKKEINTQNETIVSSENSYYKFNRLGKLKYMRRGGFSVLKNRFGKDSISMNDNHMRKEKVIEMHHYNDDGRISKLERIYTWRDTSIVKQTYHYTYPNDSTRIETKKVGPYTKDLESYKNSYALREWKVITVFDGKLSYRSSRLLPNGKKDGWYQEKTFDMNGNLTGEGEYWHDSVTYGYNADNRLTYKKINGGESIYRYSYDKEGNRDGLTIEYNKISGKSKLVVTVDYTYGTKKSEWTSCTVYMDYYRYPEKGMVKNGPTTIIYFNKLQ